MRFFSIYIHIPFCVSKCNYCDFNSYCNKNSFVEKYVVALIQNIKKSQYFKQDDICKSIYIGGGTPSYIQSEHIVNILSTVKEKYNISDDCEITIEVNPSSANLEKLTAYKNIGINRISMGLQTSNNEILNIIGRKHDYVTFLEKYNLLKECGFSNINVDLMIGLPNQKLEDVINSVNEVVELRPMHISCYSLILHEDTQLYRDVEDNKYFLPSEQDEREMYYQMSNILKEHGYNQYEISNFCLNDKISIHNTMCWDQQEYIGFGAGAHSYFDNKRFYFENDIEKYIINSEEIVEEVLNDEEKIREYIILKLRMIEGISIEEVNKRFNIDILSFFEDEITKLVNLELLEIINENIKLTKKGLDFANIVWEEFI